MTIHWRMSCEAAPEEWTIGLGNFRVARDGVGCQLHSDDGTDKVQRFCTSARYLLLVQRATWHSDSGELNKC